MTAEIHPLSHHAATSREDKFNGASQRILDRITFGTVPFKTVLEFMHYVDSIDFPGEEHLFQCAERLLLTPVTLRVDLRKFLGLPPQSNRVGIPDDLYYIGLSSDCTVRLPSSVKNAYLSAEREARQFFQRASKYIELCKTKDFDYENDPHPEAWPLGVKHKVSLVSPFKAGIDMMLQAPFWRRSALRALHPGLTAAQVRDIVYECDTNAAARNVKEFA